jgi:hypothetical protein
MKATEAKLLEFLKKATQFVVPIYQRTYSWGEKECQQLWDDILRAGRNDKVPAHFVGSIVYVEKGLYQVSSQSPLLVIDGQQRLTTAKIKRDSVNIQLRAGKGDIHLITMLRIAIRWMSPFLVPPLRRSDRRRDRVAPLVPATAAFPAQLPGQLPH